VACAVAQNRGDPAATASYQAAVEAYSAHAKGSRTIISAGAVVTNCKRVVDVFLGEYAVLDAVEARNVSVLSAKEESSSARGGACLRDAILQVPLPLSRPKYPFTYLTTP
jgi:hypothetical protein